MQKGRVASRQTRLREHGKMEPKVQVRLAAKEDQQSVSGEARARKENPQADSHIVTKDGAKNGEAVVRQEKIKPGEQVRLAAREDRNPTGKEDGVRQRDQAQQPAEPDEDADRDEDEGSGGASRGNVARDSSSGGASRGTTVYPKAESGGAGHGEHIRKGDSGGASGY